jgi:hypothetical protein
MGMERRRAPRYQFVADAELLDLQSGARSKAKTGDLSIGGCFVDTLNPAAEGTELRVTIAHGGRRFTAEGRVVFKFPRLGMGLNFTHVAPDQLPSLEMWLAELERRRSASPALVFASHQESRA